MFVLLLAFSAALIVMVRKNGAPAPSLIRKQMTIENMKSLVKKHADLETKHDLEGVLATLVEDPVYEIYPARLKLQDKENVRAFYREHFDSFFPLIASFTLINEWWAPESACMEYDLFLKAPYADKPYRILVVLTAKNNLLLGERFYINDELAQLMSGTAFSLWKKLQTYPCKPQLNNLQHKLFLK